MLLAFALCSTTDAGKSKLKRTPPYVSFETYGLGVKVVSLDGRLLLRLGQRKPWKRGFRTAYFSPTVHPNQHALAVVKCEVDPAADVGYQMRDCAIVEVNLVDASERVLATQHGERAFGSLTWAGRGRYLVAFEGKRLTILDRASGDKIWTSEEDVRAHLGRFWEDESIRFVSSTQLAIQSDRPCDSCTNIGADFGTLDVVTKTLTWECTTRDMPGQPECEEGAAFRTYYPSPYCPTCRILNVSADGRYVLYWKPGRMLFCKETVMLHDRETGDRKQLAVLQRKFLCV